MSRTIHLIKAKYNETGLALFLFKRKWRKQNPKNDSFPVNIFPIDHVRVGDYSYGALNVLTFGSHDGNLQIGRYCSIAKEVSFLLGGEHYYDRLTTSPIEKYIFGEQPNIKCNGDIVIGDDVWIGYRATILSGVHIGQGAVIAAGAIVCKDIPPYAVYAGNKVVKYRFPEETIAKLTTLDYGKVTPDYIRSHRDMFTHALDTQCIHALITDSILK